MNENELLTVELDIIENLIAEYTDLRARYGRPEFAPEFIAHAFSSLTLLLTEVRLLQGKLKEAEEKAQYWERYNKLFY